MGLYCICTVITETQHWTLPQLHHYKLTETEQGILPKKTSIFGLKLPLQPVQPLVLEEVAGDVARSPLRRWPLPEIRRQLFHLAGLSITYDMRGQTKTCTQMVATAIHEHIKINES